MAKTYEETGTIVFRDFNETIADGELVFLTGESGSGKSTLIHMLLKEVELSGGEILVNDRPLTGIKQGDVPKYRRKIGVVFQDFHLVQEMTAYENVEIARRIAGAKRAESRAIIGSLFSLLGITHLHKRYPKELSGGEQQKVCIARALVNHPDILLADEPTGNLSPAASGEIMRLFELINRQGTTVVVATHDLSCAGEIPYREIAL